MNYLFYCALLLGDSLQNDSNFYLLYTNINKSMISYIACKNYDYEALKKL
jgi:hypothetical protein